MKFPMEKQTQSLMQGLCASAEAHSEESFVKVLPKLSSASLVIGTPKAEEKPKFLLDICFSPCYYKSTGIGFWRQNSNASRVHNLQGLRLVGWSVKQIKKRALFEGCSFFVTFFLSYGTQKAQMFFPFEFHFTATKKVCQLFFRFAVKQSAIAYM